ncbi:hypothetical protein [Nocardioides lijunqiniae]|uniref:hypothetical protein n=1 Tax=Nocardioides lijunqiniae TaxID=2760832 RepID=UPI001877DACB|nr:hypothetical protein [Nocardioides lijunqiniae]
MRTDEIGPVGPMREPSLNPSDADWWWQYGLDGFGGALLGGLLAGAVTWWAVRRTIQHERELNAQGQDDSRMLELRELATRAMAAATSAALVREDEDEGVLIDKMAELVVAAILVEPRASELAPMLETDLVSFRNALESIPEPRSTNFRLGAGRLTGALRQWLRDPAAYEKTAPLDWSSGPIKDPPAAHD